MSEAPARMVAAADHEIARAERLLEVTHVAKRLSVSRQYVRELCRSRALPSIRLGRRWRVRPSDLERFIESRRTPAENILDS